MSENDPLSSQMKQPWFFTFGHGHKHPQTGESMTQRFVMVENATFNESRKIMVDAFGDQWHFQYDYHEFKERIKRLGLIEYKLENG